MNNYPDGMTKEDWQHIDGYEHRVACPLHENNYPPKHDCQSDGATITVEWHRHSWNLAVTMFRLPTYYAIIDHCPWCLDELVAPECQCEQIKEGMRPCP